MLWKDSLALWIQAHPECNKSVKVWNEVRNQFTSVRVKTVDSHRKVVNISIEQNGKWDKPDEWALNHIQSIRDRVNDDLSRINNLLPPDEVIDLLGRQIQTIQKLHSESRGLKQKLNDLESVNKGLDVKLSEANSKLRELSSAHKTLKVENDRRTVWCEKVSEIIEDIRLRPWRFHRFWSIKGFRV